MRRHRKCYESATSYYSYNCDTNNSIYLTNKRSCISQDSDITVMSYIKAYIEEFQKRIRIYLDNRPNTFSFISGNLIDALAPQFVEQDDKGNYFVALNLVYQNIHQEDSSLTVLFEVLETPGNDIVIGDDILHNYENNEDSVIFDGGTVKVYHCS